MTIEKARLMLRPDPYLSGFSAPLPKGKKLPPSAPGATLPQVHSFQ
jgi:hypothetical protein